MAKVLTTTDISQVAATYQNDIRYLAVMIVGDEIAKLRIRMLQVGNEDVITKFRRQAGIIKPYTVGATLNAVTDLGEFAESKLKVENVYGEILENIQNYKEVKVLNNPKAGTGYNQDKKHPLEQFIVEQIAKSVAEDVSQALFFGVRNTAVPSVLTSFDGFNKKIDAAVVSGEISAANGNLITTGTIVAPTSSTDTTPIDKIVKFVRDANFNLRNKPAVLKITKTVYAHAVDALENKYKYKSFDLNGVEMYINEKCQSKISLATSEILGTGSRIKLTVPDNFDFGMDTFGDYQFVQARSYERDPNIVQYWVQFAAGVRIIDFHQKSFAVNEQSAVGSDFAGDFAPES
jgi:hypothetical protein